MLDPLHRFSVRTKLALLFVGLCLIAYGLGGTLVSHWAEGSLEQEILTRLEIQCRAYARGLDASLELLERRAEDFASDGYIRDRAERLEAAGDPAHIRRLQEELRRHLADNKLPLEGAFRNLSVTAADGSVLASAQPGEALLGSPTGALDGPTRAGNLRTDGPPGLVISTPLRRLHDGGTVGRLHVLVDAEAWIASALVDGLGAEEGGAVPDLTLHDREGQHLVVTLDDAGVRVRHDPDSTTPSRGPDAPVRFSPVRGTYARSFPIPHSGWWVEVDLDIDDTLAPLWSLRNRLLAVGVALAVLSSLLLYFPMRFVIRPLVELTRAAERLREGELETRVETTSRDEIGALGQAFNAMADAIGERTHRLETTAADLRDRQAEVRAERDRLDGVIASMHDGLAVLDAEGRVLLANAAARPLLELIERDGLGTSRNVCADGAAGSALAHADAEHDCFHCLLDPVGPPRSCCVDVGPRSFELHTTPLPPDDAGRRGRVLVAREVTDRIQQDEREIHNERLAVLGEVAAVMAHELNNPLASISMFNQLLAAELPDESPLRENTDVIARNTDAAKHTIRELLDYATGATPEVGPLDVHASLEDTQRFLHPLSERAGVAVRLDPGAEQSEVTGDEVQLRQVFVNLAMNAIQAVAAQALGPGNGRAGDARKGEVALVTRNEGDRLVIDVIDTGPGIPASDRERVFRPFFTTKSRGEGTGLGLPTARRIAEMHGGSLEVARSSGEGTVFRVRLRCRAPAVAERPTSIVPAERA